MSDSFDRDATRTQVRKIIQLMNQYELLEFEYEDKEGETSIDISRSSADNFPPLLEGRSEAVPGKLRAPAVGRLHWEAEAGDRIEQGDVVAVVEHHEESTDVVADASGVLTDPIESSHVEYGQHLGSVVPESEHVDEEDASDDEGTDDPEDDDE